MKTTKSKISGGSILQVFKRCMSKLEIYSYNIKGAHIFHDFGILSILTLSVKNRVGWGGF